MSDTTVEQRKYEITIEDAGPARKRLSITVAPEVIDEKISDSMGTLATQTQLPGFRKGRAPKALLERRFGKSVRTETKNQIVADAYAVAIEEHKLRPVGEPEPVGDLEAIEIVDGKPLEFAVEIEVVPEFDLPDLENIEVKKPVIDVTQEYIEAELDRQCTQAGEVVPVESGFSEGDRIIGSGSVTKEGDDDPFFSHDTIDIIVPGDADDGRGQVLGLLIDGVADAIKGKKIGDALDFEAVGPESHELEHIRGQKLKIHIDITEGHRIEPATPQAVVDQYGLGSEDILREQIQIALEQRRDEEQRAAMREQICQHLLETVDFELPKRLSETQAARMLERQRLEMLYRGGLSADEVERRLAEIREETEAQSQSRLKLSFIMNRLAEHFGVEVSDQEVNGRIAQIAAQRGVRPEQLRAEMIQSGAVQQLAIQIREHKSADRVIDKASVTEIPADEWNVIAEEKSAARKKTGSKKKKTTTKKTGSKKKTTSKKKTAKKTSDD